MKFSEFAEYLQKLEETPKRLEITAILADLIKKASAKEIDTMLYLSLGYLKPPFESEKFNIASKMMLKALETAYKAETSVVKKLYTKTGDLGDTAYELDTKKEKADLEVTTVHQKLLEIAQAQGTGSQEEKITKLATLLKKLSRLSAKYVARIVLGTTRLGFTELTVLDALVATLAKKDTTKARKKSLKEQIEQKYNMHPDIGLIARRIKERGLQGIETITMEPGVPILAQKPQRLSNPEEILEKMDGEAWGEYKFDGTRVQLHLDRTAMPHRNTTQRDIPQLFENTQPKFLIKTYTRNLEETTHQFPDILEAAAKQIDAKSAILDGEAVGYDKKTGEFLPFQKIIKRKRKHNIKKALQEIPLKYFVFDLLYLNGKPLLDKPLTKRRELLNKIIKKGPVLEVDTHVHTTEPKKLMNFFEDSKEKGLEGLVVKNPNSPYQAGARSFAWIKLKKAATELLEDDFDCVILGYYHGRGARSKFGIGGFLAGVYDPKEDSFKSITKVGTGLKDTQWVELKNKVDKLSVKEKPKNVKVKKELYPNVWTQPKLVAVLKADEITKSPTHTAGYALRFPRFIKLRTDKKPEDTTSVKEIKDLHKGQKRGYY